MSKKKDNYVDFGPLLGNKKNYYSIEIYPPDLYDEEYILKKDVQAKSESRVKSDMYGKRDIHAKRRSREIREPDQNLCYDDNLEIEMVHNSVSDESDDDNVSSLCSVTSFIGVGTMDRRGSMDQETLQRKIHESNMRKLTKIVQYIKGDWLTSVNNEVELPFYKPTNWKTIDSDMFRLSDKFVGWIFIVYCKSELFVDNLSVKIYRNGRMIHANNNIELEIKIKLPNGLYKTANRNGIIEFDSEYDISRMLNPTDRGIGDVMNTIEEVGMVFGKTALELGSLVSGGAVVCQVLSIGLTFVDEMHQNMIRYGNNKGRSKKLYDRCNNIVGALQNTDKEALNLGYVVSVIQQVQESKGILKKYGKQWKVTKFFRSGSNKRKFVNINGDLSDSVLDFGVNYQIRQNLFT